MSREKKPFNSDKPSRSGSKKPGNRTTRDEKPGFKQAGKRDGDDKKRPAFKRDGKSDGDNKKRPVIKRAAKDNRKEDDKPAMFTKRTDKSEKPSLPQKEYGDSKPARPGKFKDRPEKSTVASKKNTSRTGRTVEDSKPLKSRFGDRDFREKRSTGDPLPSFSGDVRLNKYISNAGICSRREADVMIASGIVQVNGKTVTELGYKVKPDDVVKYDGATIRSEKKQYVLLNKPKDFITTMDDPMDRKTVMLLVAKACRERIYPVGRLDRNTTGVLLFTNDGDLAKKLTHPRYEIKKLYHVETAEPVTAQQISALLSGVELDDGGFVKADKAEILKDSKGREVGIEIHSGKYRVVRRMFEAIGHSVKKLDRVSFAGLTKKDLPRGNYRHLTEQEVAFLRML